MPEMNPVGKPYALIGHVRFDEGPWGQGLLIQPPQLQGLLYRSRCLHAFEIGVGRRREDPASILTARCLRAKTRSSCSRSSGVWAISINEHSRAGSGYNYLGPAFFVSGFRPSVRLPPGIAGGDYSASHPSGANR
jgi:hypothetical protein